MSTRVKTKRRLFSFESLESRTMLAGDVTVAVTNGDLVVTGDDEANTVVIEGTGQAGDYVIDGEDGTNIFFNGQLQGGAFIVTGATGNIVVDLNGGDDTLGINNVAVDILNIDMDEGADIVRMGAYEAFGGIIGDGSNVVLPTGPEVNNGSLIDNDVAVNTIGHFEVNLLAGGESREGGFTAQGQTLLFVNEDFIFDYFSYIDVGANGGAVRLGSTTITQVPTLISPDVVESRGTFTGQNGLINWVATSSIGNGDSRIANTITFTAATLQLGDLSFISYLDEDVGDDPADDIMFASGTPGSADFKVFTLDGPERVGFAQSGVYSPGTGLVNATWDGWAADVFSDLRTAITGAGTTYSVNGNIDIGAGANQLPQSTDPDLGTVFGPRDVTTAFAWSVDPQAVSATITTFLEFVPRGADDIDPEDGSVGVNESLVINTDGGADLVQLVRVFGGGDWDINLGDDNDTTNNNTDANPDNNFAGVNLDDQLYIFIASGGNIDLNGGSGDDLVNINYLTVNEAFVADGVTGNDVISINGSVFNDEAVLLGGSGFDTLAVDFSRHDGGDEALLILDAGADSDFILFARSLVTEGQVHIRSGGGSDRVVIGRYYADISGTLATGGNVVGELHLDTGSEGDVADIRANVVDEFFGIFGGGDDDVTVGFNRVSLFALLDGGSGFDELFASGNIFNDADIVGFESTSAVLSP